MESGASLTDHAVRRPDKLKLEGWVSDLIPSAEADRTLPLPARAEAAWVEIDKLLNARQPVNVVTRLKFYRNMLLVKATAPVNRSSGYGLRFALELEEVLFKPLQEVEGGLTIVPARDSPAADRAESVNRGHLAVTELPTTEAEAILFRRPA